MVQRAKVSYNLKASTIKEFNVVAKQYAVNKSALIDLLINQWIEEQKKIKK